MDWFSFSLGFLAFPLLSAVGFAVYLLTHRFLGAQDKMSNLAISQRTSTLSFSSRLIGEIGEEVTTEPPGKAAKAS